MIILATVVLVFLFAAIVSCVLTSLDRMHKHVKELDERMAELEKRVTRLDDPTAK